MKHVVLYVGHLCKLFWTKKIWPGWQGGSGKVKIGQNMAQNRPRFWLWTLWMPLNGSRTPETDPKWYPQLPLVDLNPFQRSLTHLGASRGLQSQKRSLFWAIFWPILTFPDPPCQPGQIFLVQNGLYMCPTYSTTCFMLKSHLWGVF